MNPVLLKPNTDIGAQVIIHGRAVTSMDAAAYHDYKRVAMEAVLASHGRLAAAYRVVMVEGAARRRRSTCAPTTSPTWASPKRWIAR